MDDKETDSNEPREVVRTIYIIRNIFHTFSMGLPYVHVYHENAKVNSCQNTLRLNDALGHLYQHGIHVYIYNNSYIAFKG